MARVLVADNDPDARDLVALDLRLEGHTVSAVADGNAVLAAVESFAPDVVVLDHRMPPGPTGLEVAVALRADRPDLRVLLYTNYQSVELTRQAADHDITFIPKGNLRTLRVAIVPQ